MSRRLLDSTMRHDYGFEVIRIIFVEKVFKFQFIEIGLEYVFSGAYGFLCCALDAEVA